MAEVRLASGRRIDWHNPPRSNQIASLTLNGHTYKGSFRTCCHINRLNNLARKRFGEGLTVFQGPYHLGVSASAGTHDKDACWDLWISGVPAYTQQRFFRANGFGCWYRHPPLFGNHIHGFTLPPHRGTVSDDFQVAGMTVGKYIDGGLSLLGHTVASSQIADYYAHAWGLAGQHRPGSDRSWFPRSIPDSVFNLKAYVQRRTR